MNTSLKEELSLNQKQLDAVAIVTQGREDPVLFLEKALGLNFYPQQKIWLWATTHTQKEKCYRLMREMNIFFTTPDDLISQMDTLYGFDKHILAVANQIGKTFLTACKHIWSLYFKIGIRVSPQHFMTAEYKTLNISPHSDQSSKGLEYVERIIRGEMIFYDEKTNTTRANEVHPVIEGFLVGKNENLGELRFANGSFFYSKSSGQDKGTSRAGEQFGYISFDECAQSRHLNTEIAMLLSRLIRYGYSFDLISSPEVEKPSHQAYYRLVKKGGKLEDGWFALTNIGFDTNTFIHPDQKEKAKESLRSTDIQKYKQMIEGKFVMTGNRFLPLQAVERLFNHGGRLRRLQQGIPGRKYLLCADWGMSDTGDASWFFVLDWTDYIRLNRIDIVAHEKVVGGSPTMQLAALRIMYQNFGGDGEKDSEGNVVWEKVLFISDTNSLGGVMIKKMLFDLHPLSFGSHGGQKDQMLAAVQATLTFGRDFTVDEVTGEIVEKNPDYGKVRSYFIEELEEQLGSYKVEDTKIEQDAVMSLGMGLWYLEKRIPKTPDKKMALNPLSRYNSLRSQVF